MKKIELNKGIRAIKFAKALMKNNPNMNIDGDDGK